MTDVRIGVDIGGTFTDVVLHNDAHTLHRLKVLSTPDDYSRGILEGVALALEQAGTNPATVSDLVHATTVATNTILEQKGARTALVTTTGFRDVLEMRRLRIPILYDLQYQKPLPLVPRRLRLEVGGRLGPGGEEWEALREEDVERAATILAEADVESVAVVLLHSYANPTHEARVVDSLRQALGKDVFVCSSSEILPEIREYERTSTAVVNAYVGPVVERYMTALEQRLNDKGIAGDVHIMLSNGGVMSVDMARRKPAYLVESGPAAGVIACARAARAAGHDNVISFDMGGTTAKAAMIEGGRVAKTTEYEVGAGINLSAKLVKGGGYPVKLSFIDVSEIGAGGGSLVRLDDAGRITVGPESAGADPGPVCYGQGGREPTLTDALVTLGYINPDAIAGGTMRLDADAARRAFERQVASPLGMTTTRAAIGVLTLACATMTRAVKAVSTYRGRDPRDFTLVAFGGNGPVVAAEVARALGMRRVVVPPAPGVFSAVGLLFSDLEHELTRTVLGQWEEPTPAAIDAVYTDMAQEARNIVGADGVEIERIAELRYRGQAYELPVDIPAGEADIAQMASAFAAEHERTYGYRSDSEPIELVNLKLVIRKPMSDTPKAPVIEPEHETTMRTAYFGAAAEPWETPVANRSLLAAGPREGPLIIEEADATCVIPPGCRAQLDATGNIDIEIAEAS